MYDNACAPKSSKMVNRKLQNSELCRPTEDEYRAIAKLPIVVILDNVRSLNNVGAVFRTSDALLVERILLCGITGTPPSSEIHKTALGAENSVEWQYFEQTSNAIELVRSSGYAVVAVEQTEQSIDLINFCPAKDKKYALVFGNELRGVDQSIVDISDCCIEIPQSGVKHSFNISVSAGIVLWDFYTKLRK